MQTGIRIKLLIISGFCCQKTREVRFAKILSNTLRISRLYEARFPSSPSRFPDKKMVPREGTAGYQIFPERELFPARRNLSGISRSHIFSNTTSIFKWYSVVLYFSKSSSGKSVLASDFALFEKTVSSTLTSKFFKKIFR